MGTPTDRKALRRFRDPLLEAVKCVDMSARLVEYPVDSKCYWLGTGERPISFGPSLELVFSITVELVRTAAGQRATTVKYDYMLERTAEKKRCFGWHWHPRSKVSPIKEPHLHIEGGVNLDYSTRHIPTGRMCLEDILLFGLKELKVPPAKTDAVGVVTRLRDAHRRNRTWHYY